MRRKLHGTLRGQVHRSVQRLYGQLCERLYGLRKQVLWLWLGVFKLFELHGMRRLLWLYELFGLSGLFIRL